MKAFRSFISKRRQSYQSRKKANAPAPASMENNAAPAAAQQQVVAQAADGTLQLALQNKTNSGTVYAYITGLALERGNAPIFVQADGRTIYQPSTPATVQSPLQADVAIPLGAPGNTVYVRIPKIAGGRIWFSIGAKLTFLLNPGPAVVEPSVTNPSDPNFNLNWTFCEFTYNDAQLFANISYVDFVSIPIALTLESSQAQTQTVPGMRPDGFQAIANGQPLRVLSPNNLLVGKAGAWGNYWDGYVQAVWNKFRNEDMIINTQAAAGNLRGRVQSNNQLQFPEAGNFDQPTAADIFSCSTGPFATGANAARNAVIPRLAAAFNRSILLNTPSNQFPNGSNPSQYYKDPTTNHYSRLVHDVQKDGRGYAFPYDDVVPDGGQDVAGTLFAGSPTLFTIAVGGQ
ncbi:hypothetical protein P3342_000871 [Pyrenophora teres f. teres]|nr:hypothetical protein P3342_000871 [Pyrenophora teres f. teres]